MNIKKGDTVEVISGKDIGKKGKVLKVEPKENKVVVEGVNKVKRHQKPNRKIPQGGILNVEKPLQASNVMLVCDKCKKPTRPLQKVLGEDEKVRICRKCGEVLK